MRAIFISYRREDAEGQAGRLFDELVDRFGADAVFMDVAAIEPGRDFRRAIEQHVASCGVLLAVIGRGWLEARNEAGTRRLEDPLDFVRLETASALKRDIPVIPVLVHGARMPLPEQLPADLAELAYRNGVELTHARWDSDVERLCKSLAAHVAPQAAGPSGTAAAPAGENAPLPAPAARTPATPPRRAAVLLAGVAALALAVGGYLFFASAPDHDGRKPLAASGQQVAAAQRSDGEQRLAAEQGAAAEQGVAAEQRAAAEQASRLEAEKSQRAAAQAAVDSKTAETRRLASERARAAQQAEAARLAADQSASERAANEQLLAEERARRRENERLLAEIKAENERRERAAEEEGARAAQIAREEAERQRLREAEAERQRLREAEAGAERQRIEARRLAEERARAGEQAARWTSRTFGAPNGGLLAYTFMPDGNPACASYDGANCLWGIAPAQLDWRRLQPLACGEAHRRRWNSTGYEDPKHWCSLARSEGARPRAMGSGGSIGSSSVIRAEPTMPLRPAARPQP